MRKSIPTLTLGALLVVAPAAFAAGGHMGGMAGGMGGGFHSSLSAPMHTTVSPSSTAPTNPNTRSGKALGQPSQTCQNASNYPANTPGNSFTAPGSAFNSVNGTAGSVYAGSGLNNQKNTASVSQYDVACYRP